MTKLQRDDLIYRAGNLAAPEQVLLADELTVYVRMALRLEDELHKAIKALDKAEKR
jgi:hypothetical protein